MAYQFQTTFWTDFAIADVFGADAVRDTYERSFRDWKDEVVYMTELVLVLNWRCWKHWEDGNDELGRLYHDLYYECDGWCCEHFTGDDARYYFETTD